MRSTNSRCKHVVLALGLGLIAIMTYSKVYRGTSNGLSRVNNMFS